MKLIVAGLLALGLIYGIFNPNLEVVIAIIALFLCIKGLKG